MNGAAGISAPPSTLLPALRWAEHVLREGRIDEPRLASELLLCHILGCDRIRLYVDFEKSLRPDEVDAFVNLVRRRLAHEPVQYITGEAGFMGLRIEVDSRVLIPRPETETLVEEALGFCRRTNARGLRILDAGTGSGNIAVAVARYETRAAVTGVDVSRGALEVAAANARRLGVANRVALVRSDLLRADPPFRAASFHMIVSNPPYIPTAEMAALDPEIRFEPAVATSDGGDGLRFFYRLADIAPGLLVPGGILIVETAYNQARAVEEVFLSRGLQETAVTRDLQGVERVVAARR